MSLAKEIFSISKRVPPYMKKELAGKRFGKLVVIEEAARSPDNTIRWNCLCDCGGRVTMRSASILRKNSVKSCGCVKSVRDRLSKTLVGSSWENMIQRCYNPKAKGFNNYGARGVSVCSFLKCSPAKIIQTI